MSNSTALTLAYLNIPHVRLLNTALHTHIYRHNPSHPLITNPRPITRKNFLVQRKKNRSALVRPEAVQHVSLHRSTAERTAGEHFSEGFNLFCTFFCTFFWCSEF